jgi:hypothetical protein
MHSKHSFKNNAGIISFPTTGACAFSSLIIQIMSSINILKRYGLRPTTLSNGQNNRKKKSVITGSKGTPL